VRSAWTEWVPQELLAITPPSVQWSWVAVSGPEAQAVGPGGCLEAVRDAGGLDRAGRVPGPTSITRRRWREKSISTAVLADCPAMAVPPPRGSTGAQWAADT
jgi:hypothetical protein